MWVITGLCCNVKCKDEETSILRVTVDRRQLGEDKEQEEEEEEDYQQVQLTVY